MHQSSAGPPPSPRRRLVFLGVTLGVWALGTYGYWLHGTTHGSKYGDPYFLEYVYRAAQLFVLHMPHEQLPLPWPLEFARFLAPAIAFVAVAEAMFSLARRRITRLRVQRQSDHILVCGAGWKGLRLAKEYQERGERVVVVERDEANPGLVECETLGIPVQIGDASDPQLLESLNAHKAKVLLATAGSDGANLQIATAARNLTAAKRDGERHALQCFVDIRDVADRTLFRQQPILAGDDRRIIVTVTGVDLYENSARRLFQKYPLHEGADSAKVLGVPHLVLLGFGQMGESVLLQAARIAHYPGGHRLQVTVFDPAVDLKERQFRDRYPRIDSACDVVFESCDPDNPQLLDRAAGLCRQAGQHVTVVVCFPEDSFNTRVALGLSRRLSGDACRVRVRLDSEDGLASLVTREDHAYLDHDRFTPFGSRAEACTVEMLERSKQDKLARAIHDHYVAKEREKGETPESNPSMRPWEKQNEVMRDSNRYAADHIDIKLWSIGASRVPASRSEPVVPLSAEQIEVLAPTEHARYCADRFLAGWAPAPAGQPKDHVARVNPTLIPWEELSEEEKEKDRWAVGQLPELLGMIGERIVW